MNVSVGLTGEIQRLSATYSLQRDVGRALMLASGIAPSTSRTYAKDVDTTQNVLRLLRSLPPLKSTQSESHITSLFKAETHEFEALHKQFYTPEIVEKANKKLEEKKAAAKKPEEKKPDEKKADDKKPEDNKPVEKKAEEKKPDDKATQKKVDEAVLMLEFWKELIDSSKPQAKAGTIFTELKEATEEQKRAQSLLGQLLYLMDKDPGAIALEISKGRSFEKRRDNLTSQFNVELQALKLLAEGKASEEAGLKIFNADTLAATIPPKVVAKALITKDGFLNLGIARFLLDTIYPNRPHAEVFIKDLQQKGIRWEIVTDSKATAKEDSLANVTIRAMFDLPAGHKVSDADVRRAVIASFLAQVAPDARIPDCGGAEIAAEIRATNADLFGRDINGFLTTDSMERAVMGRDAVKFTLAADIEELNSKIDLNVDGGLYQTSGIFAYAKNLWEAQGFKVAARALGIADKDKETDTEFRKEYIDEFKKAVAVLAEQQKVGPKGLLKVTPKDIILALAKNDAPKAAVACHAFASVIVNPFAESWKDAIRELAEQKPRAIVEGNFAKALRLTLKEQFQPANIGQYLEYNQLFKKVQADLVNARNVVYNEKGDFVLEKVTATADGFRTFVATTVAKTLTEHTQAKDASVQADWKALSDRVVAFINTPAFIQSVVQNFDPANRGVTDPSGKYLAVEFTPWNSKNYINPAQALGGYLEEQPRIKKLEPSDARALFEQLIDATRDQNVLIVQNARTAVQVTVKGSVYEKAHAAKSSKAFVADYARDAKSAWEKATISAEQRKTVLEWVKKNLFTSQESADIFEATDWKTMPASSAWAPFRVELMVRLRNWFDKDHMNLDDKSQNRAERMLDTFLFSNVLPEAVKPFITPISDGEKQLCVYPVLTLKDGKYKELDIRLGLWDGSTLVVKDKKKWLHGQAWDVLKVSSSVRAG